MKLRVSIFQIFSAILALLVTGIWIGNWIYLGSKYDMAEAGQFGDRFGASTSLFGGITIILLLYTIYLQRREIADGKKEFRIQNKILKIQRVETTFLNLLKSHNEFIETLSTQDWEDKTVHGKLIFSHFNYLYYSYIAREKDSSRDKYQLYDEVILNEEPAIEMYLSSLDIPLRFIDQSKLSEKDKKFYYSIVLSQMSTAEQLALGYHLNHTKRKGNSSDLNLDRIKLLIDSWKE